MAAPFLCLCFLFSLSDSGQRRSHSSRPLVASRAACCCCCCCCRAGYVDLYPLESVAPPKQLTLDRSIDPVAWSAFPMNAPAGGGAGSSSTIHQFEATGAGVASPPPTLQSSGVCGSFHADTGGGHREARVAAYPEGLMVHTMSECCQLCAPGNSINCSAWIYRGHSSDGGAADPAAAAGCGGRCVLFGGRFG
jgi:hypothetical protein